MIKIHTATARTHHGYSDEKRRGLLYGIITDIAYIAQERGVQSWTLKVSNQHMSLMCQLFRNGKPDLMTEDIIVNQFLHRGIQQEFITINRTVDS